MVAAEVAGRHADRAAVHLQCLERLDLGVAGEEGRFELVQLARDVVVLVERRVRKNDAENAFVVVLRLSVTERQAQAVQQRADDVASFLCRRFNLVFGNKNQILRACPILSQVLGRLAHDALATRAADLSQAREFSK